MVLLFTGVWPDSTQGASIRSKAAEVMASIDSAAAKMGLLHRFRYANYANADQKPLQSYGEGNVGLLHRVAGRYDPDGVFQKLVPGGFKLGRS